jgi:hypothetical protein
MNRKEVEGLTVEIESRLTPREERRGQRKPVKRRTGALITLADLVLIVVMALFLFYITQNGRPQQTQEFSYLLKVQEFNNLALISLEITAKNELTKEGNLDISFFWNQDITPFYEELVNVQQFTPSYTVYLAVETPLTEIESVATLQVQVAGIENIKLQQKLVRSKQ